MLTFTPQPSVLKASTLPLDHRSRFIGFGTLYAVVMNRLLPGVGWNAKIKMPNTSPASSFTRQKVTKLRLKHEIQLLYIRKANKAKNTLLCLTVYVYNLFYYYCKSNYGCIKTSVFT
jgi:hypothetical protein